LWITPSPIHTAIGALTPTPALPIAVQALLQGEMTPVFNVQVGQPRFSTEINNYQLVAPAAEFSEPDQTDECRIYISTIGVESRVDRSFGIRTVSSRIFDSKSWKSSAPGLGISSWARPAQDWSRRQL